MPDSDLRSWELERLQKKKDQIVALDAAISALESGHQMYQLDTGQTRQMVSRAQIGQLRDERRKLEQEVRELHVRLYGGSSRTLRPGF